MASAVPVPVNHATVDVEQWRQTLEAMRLMANKIAALESQKVGNR